MSASHAQEPRTAANLGPAAPVFRVEDLEASIDYYVNRLGFEVDWRDPVGFASVSRDKCTIFLSAGDQGHPGTWVWIGIADCEALHEEFRARDAKVRHPPTNYYWALEMQVEDPDGNVLRLGSEPKKDEPFGEWLDMHGRRWAPQGESGWTRVE